MSGNIILGFGIVVVCVAIQCTFVGLLLRVLIHMDQRNQVHTSFIAATTMLTISVFLLLIGNLVQVSVWAFAFIWLGEFESFSTAVYHSIVNFSTLGYGDIVMSQEHRMLGALEAANGVVMFGLSTGAIFMVLSNIMQKAWDNEKSRSSGN